jgi:hypothetical protein
MAQPTLRQVQMPEMPSRQILAQRIAARMPPAPRRVPVAPEPDPSVSSMAQRFAPEAVRTAKNAAALAAARETAPAARSPEARRFGVTGRSMMTVLTVVAIAPAAIVAGLLWLDTIAGPDGVFDFSQFRTWTTQQAAMAATPLLRPVPRMPDIVLTAPEEIVAKAGEDVSFAIAIDTAEALPERSVIAIRDLPEGAAFSEGRPYGAKEWNLRPDEIAGLTLRLPNTDTGTADFRIELVAADGRVLAQAATRLEIAPAPDTGLMMRSDEADRIEELMSYGHKMMAVGYFAGARAYFMRAAESGSGDAALALGATYDPAVITVIGAQGIKPDFMAAKSWYDRAATLGATNHATKLAGLKQHWSEGHEPLAKATSAEPAEAANAPVETESQAPDDDKPGPIGRLVAAASELTGKDEWLQTVGSVNVRAGPSSNADTQKIVQKGLKLRVLGREGNWVQIADPATKLEGWIYTRYLGPVD